MTECSLFLCFVQRTLYWQLPQYEWIIVFTKRVFWSLWNLSPYFLCKENPVRTKKSNILSIALEGKYSLFCHAILYIYTTFCSINFWNFKNEVWPSVLSTIKQSSSQIISKLGAYCTTLHNQFFLFSLVLFICLLLSFYFL